MLKDLAVLSFCAMFLFKGGMASEAIDNLEKRLKTQREQDKTEQELSRQRQVLPRVSKEKLHDSSRVKEVTVSGFELRGSRVFDKTRLNSLLSEYIGKPVNSKTLRDVTSTLNAFYAEKNYIYSRVRVDQTGLHDGVIYLVADEAKVTKLQLKGNHGIEKNIILSNFETSLSTPINQRSLSDSITLLKQNALVRDVNAYLYPVDKNNHFALMLDIEERRRNEYILMVNNYLSPSVGAESIQAVATLYNKLGLGDETGFNLGVSQGVYQFGMAYRMPLTWHNMYLSLRGAYTQGRIVESVFSELDIKNTSNNIDARMGRNIRWLGFNHSLAAGLQWRTQNTQIAGYDWGDDDAENVTMIYSWAGQNSYRNFYWQSTLEYLQGLYEVGPSSSLSSFVQYGLLVNRATGLIGSDRIEMRVSGQWAINEISRLNRFSLGGSRFLRGYRENAVQADRAITGTFEYHLPLLVGASFIAQQRILVKPFVDVALVDNESGGSEMLASMGAGVHWHYRKTLNLDLSWAFAFNDQYQAEGNLQDYGVQFSLGYRFNQ